MCSAEHGAYFTRVLAACRTEFHIFVETVAGRRGRDEFRADHEVAEAFAVVPLVRVLHERWNRLEVNRPDFSGGSNS